MIITVVMEVATPKMRTKGSLEYRLIRLIRSVRAGPALASKSWRMTTSGGRVSASHLASDWSGCRPLIGGCLSQYHLSRAARLASAFLMGAASSSSVRSRTIPWTSDLMLRPGPRTET